jgi:N-acetylmuramoyl-L-alanine amidase
MRKLDSIILHCSASEPTLDVGAAEIRKWHLNRGWKDIGYHFVIRLDGKVEQGRPVSEVGSHVAGHNAHSIGICYVGGVKNGKAADTMTAKQISSFRSLVRKLRNDYGQLELYGHNDFTNLKACPSLDVDVKFADLKLSNKGAGPKTEVVVLLAVALMVVGIYLSISNLQ